jgi:hypothetical protein
MHIEFLRDNDSNISRLLAAVILSLLIPVLISCGRRADPVVIEPPDEPEVEQREDNGESTTDMKTNGQSVKEEIGADTPPAPENLIGVFTGSSVVLTWDEVDEQDISIYRIYRAEGGEFEMIGEALTPAFTDRDVKADTKYYYRVTAVSSSESPLSEVVLISTHKNTK